MHRALIVTIKLNLKKLFFSPNSKYPERTSDGLKKKDRTTVINNDNNKKCEYTVCVYSLHIQFQKEIYNNLAGKWKVSVMSQNCDKNRKGVTLK